MQLIKDRPRKPFVCSNGTPHVLFVTFPCSLIEPTSLGVRETKLPPAKQSFDHSVPIKQVNDSRLLVTLNPTSDGDHQQCQGLDRRPHDRGF